MTKPLKLSKTEARQIALQSQFYFVPSAFPPGAEGTLAVIEHLGHIQIDTISVVERAHHHVIRSRHRDYQPSHLDELQAEPRRVFEYWSHAAAYLPMSDYRFCLPRMRRLKKKGDNWFKKDKRIMKYVLDRIEAEGPLESRHFEEPEHKPGPWWGWKPAKIALEHLFMEGVLMVKKRENFRKVYDLAERVLPPGTVTRLPTDNQMAVFLVEKALRSQGIASLKDMTYGRKDGTAGVPGYLARQVKSKKLLATDIEDVSGTFYVKRESLENLSPTPSKPVARFLSPFDNTVINRRWLKDIFDFEYQIECYVPEPKRKYGYFSLPMLYGDKFIGLVDAKAHRKEGLLAVKHLAIREMPVNEADFHRAFSAELEAFARFNGCAKVTVEMVSPARYHDFLN